MRITFLTHFPGRGGSTALAAQLFNYFQSRGHDVSLLVGNDDANPIISNYKVIPRRSGENWRERLQHYRDSIEHTRPDIVYSISGNEEFDVLRFLRVPRIRHVFSLERNYFMDVVKLVHQLRPYAEMLTANTPDVLKQICDHSISGACGMVVPYRIHRCFLEAPTIAQSAAINKRIEVCFVGRLESLQKRAHWLPRIIKRCCETGIRAQWHIYGTGPVESQIRAEVDCWRIQSFVHFHGWQDSTTLATSLRNHHIFFLCSRWEGLPIAMVEAMLCGVACVVPRIAAGITFVLGKGGGWLYEANHPQDAVRALAIAIKDRELLWRQRLEAQRNARILFGSEAVDRQLWQLEAMFPKLTFNARALRLDEASKIRFAPASLWMQRRFIELLRRFRKQADG